MSASDPPGILAGLRTGGRGRLQTAGGAHLARFVPPLMARVRRPELDELGRNIQEEDDHHAIVATLARRVLTDRARSQRLHDRADVLRYAIARASPEEVPVLLARHIAVTVPGRLDRLLDQRALRRGHLDLDCLLEREETLVDDAETRIEVACAALAGLLEAHPEAAATLQGTGAAAALVQLARTGRRQPTRRAAIRVLVATVCAASQQGGSADRALLQALDALTRSSDPWMARDALESAPARPDPAAWLRDCYARSQDPRTGALVRARCVERALALPGPLDPDATQTFAADDSELVRFCLVSALVERGAAEALRTLLRTDPSDAVRAWAAGCIAEGPAALHVLLQDALGMRPLVQRHALDACRRLHRGDIPLPDEVHAAVAHLASEGPAPLRARAQEVLVLEPVRAHPLRALVGQLAALSEGERCVVTLPSPFTPSDLAESLVPHAVDGFGFWIEPLRRGRVRVHRGDQPTVGLWRVLHELAHPAPAKRQNVRHTLVASDLGSVRVPPSTLDEASPTEVPGKRVRSRVHDSWMPGVPLPDDALDALRRGEVTLVSAHGTTVLRAAGSRLERARAWLRLTLRFTRYSALRNESLNALGGDLRDAYRASLAELGLQTEQRPHKRKGRTLRSIDVSAYLLGLGTNTTRHLLAAVLVLGVLFYLRAVANLQRMRRARASIPLIIGGWGTRGKSGTERLKMGLMTGLGIPTLAKTTGCEAMVLHTPRGRPTEDLYLFRPFDKATIWEQANVMALAQDLGSRVLLWECMALRPRFVDLLQHRWVRDDLSTITNAYADHEDVMGPSGEDVARNIATFCPDDACLVTTEGPMRPILAGEAERRATDLRVPPLHHQELFPADLLERFPYREHPANIALAVEVARALGIPRVEAVGLMAEHVVPDLGALLVYPELPIEERFLTFVNGMSANDTISFLHSWQAGGMMDVDDEDPLAWRVSVVNNRHDRVARSQVFARILVNHAPVDRHVLIGTNLGGLRGWIREELQRRAQKLPDDAPLAERRALLHTTRVVDPRRLAARLAEVHGAGAHLVAAVATAMDGTPTVPAGLPPVEALPEALRAAVGALASACENAAVAPAIEHAARRWLLAEGAAAAGVLETRAASIVLFLDAVEDVAEPAATGDEIMARVAQVAPPGARARVFGCQNIKGTGLDFAWQWVWWRQAHDALAELSRGSHAERVEALSRLQVLPIGSAAVCKVVGEALGPTTTDPELGQAAAGLRAQLAQQASALRAQRTADRSLGPWRWLLLQLERLLDPFDAILRSRSARQLFDALGASRISHGQARDRLKALNTRQKGGWIVGSKNATRSADLGVSDPNPFG